MGKRQDGTAKKRLLDPVAALARCKAGLRIGWWGVGRGKQQKPCGPAR